MVKPWHPPRPSQWEAIRATDDHVLVVAGAGTGKTHTVVGRILYLLGIEILGQQYDRPVRLDDIAAITFTNEAARDLKDQLRRALLAHGRREDAWQVDGARIGTIHSFCAELLREHGLRTGLPPFGDVLEEGAALQLATQCARDTLVEALENHDLDGLDVLLGLWATHHVDQWMVELMRKPDLMRALDERLNSPAAAGSDPTPEPERAIVRLALRAANRLDELLRREGRIDFDHMILWTRDLLRDDAELRHSVGRRLHTLIIDEFQDVDPVQKEIAFALAGLDEGRTDGTRLMLVGDPKQSIYRFRGADVTVWTSVEQLFQERRLGRVLPLRENFRSIPPILAMVEASVGRILDEPLDGNAHQPFEVRFQPVEPERVAESDEPAVECIVVPPGDDGKQRLVAEVRAEEAQAIAGRMLELRRAGHAYGDMAILLATWSNVRLYEDALRACGIPFYTLRRDGFLDTREVHDMVLALEVLRDPTDTRALFGFLRSPWIGVRDDTLLRIARFGPRPYWRHLADLDWPALPIDDNDASEETEQKRLERAQSLLVRYVALRDRVPAAELLRDLLLETGYQAYLELRGDEGRQARANVRQFLAMMREMGDQTVGDAVRAIRERRARGDRVPEAVLHAPSDDVVTITSIHVSKGLEWRTVFWADLCAGRMAQNEKLLVTKDDIRIGEPDIAAADQPDPAWHQLRAQLGQEETAELKRLWYVAATRARDRLILCGVPQGEGRLKDETLAFQLRERFPTLHTAGDDARFTFKGVDADGRPRATEWQARIRTSTALIQANAVAVVTAPAEPPPMTLPLPSERIRAPVGPPRHSATAFLTYSRCPKRHWFKYVAGIREPELPASARTERISAIARGLIVHDVLEHYREEDELDALLEDAIGRWEPDAPAPDSPTGRTYRNHLRDEVGRVIHHPDYAAMAARPGARRELPFLHLLAEDTIAWGSIDLATPAAGAAPAEDASGGERWTALELLDVKTTQCGPADAPLAAARYATQRDVYVAAAGDIAGLPVRRFAFQFSRAAVQVAEDLTPADLDRARRTVTELAGKIARGDTSLTEFPHECRFCGYRRVRLCRGAAQPAAAAADSADSDDADGEGSQLRLL